MMIYDFDLFFRFLSTNNNKLNISDQLFVPLGVYAVFVLIDGIDHLIEFVRHELINASILEGINFSDGDNPTNDNDIEFCMHDKLKMCFSEMQNIKDHFDKRRRRFPSCKKKSTPTTTMDQTTFDQQESSVGHSQMTKNVSIICDLFFV